MQAYVKLLVIIIITQTVTDTTVHIPLKHRNVRKSSVATFRSGNKHLELYDGGRLLTSGVEQCGLAPFDTNFLCARTCHELKCLQPTP